MKSPPNPKTPAAPLQAQSLVSLLEQSEQVKDLVAECAEELPSVNTVLKRKEGGQALRPEVEHAIERSEAIESKVQEAADKLSDVNRALEVEVHARHVLERRLDTVTQEKEAASHAAFHDSLTGLPNRALFDNRLAHELAQVKRHGFALAVMFLDLDGFKQINDVHGHDVGDEVLKTVADRLRENIRENDTVSRHGGDEFLCLLVAIEDEKDVLRIAEKIAAAIQVPCQLSIGELIVKASLGISIFQKNGNSAAELIKGADDAMYKAKQRKSVYAFAR